MATMIYCSCLFQWLRDRYGDSQLTRLANGSLAGLTAVCITYPLDIVRARLAYQVTGEAVYTRGIIDVLRSMFTKEGGVRALYQGITPAMIGMVPYAGKFIASQGIHMTDQNCISNRLGTKSYSWQRSTVNPFTLVLKKVIICTPLMN